MAAIRRPVACRGGPSRRRRLQVLAGDAQPRCWVSEGTRPPRPNRRAAHGYRIRPSWTGGPKVERPLHRLRPVRGRPSRLPRGTRTPVTRVRPILRAVRVCRIPRSWMDGPKVESPLPRRLPVRGCLNPLLQGLSARVLPRWSRLMRRVVRVCRIRRLWKGGPSRPRRLPAPPPVCGLPVRSPNARLPVGCSPKTVCGPSRCDRGPIWWAAITTTTSSSKMSR